MAATADNHEAIWTVMLLLMASMGQIDAQPGGGGDVCRYFANNTIIRDPYSCNRYITCIDFVSHYGDCTGSKPYWSIQLQKCVATPPTDGSICDVDCSQSIGKYVADPYSCQGYYYCRSENVSVHGICPNQLHFNETQQACIYEFESNCRLSGFDICRIVPEKVKFNDESNCQNYFICEQGELKTQQCKDTYYEPGSGMCAHKLLVPCTAHPYPKNVCGTETKPLLNTFVSDGGTCRGYFYCTSTMNGQPDPTPIWGQCPGELFFNAKQQACMEPLLTPCPATADRCEARTKLFVMSSRKGCRHYLRCHNGITDTELTCGNYFFDEHMGACVDRIILYDSCSG